MKLISVFIVFLLAVDSALGAYDAFPASEEPYTILAASADDKWSGDSFEAYGNGDIIECSNNKQAQDHLDVTSGCLKARRGGPNDRQGWTDDFIFRMVTITRDDQGRKIKWTDQSMSYQAFIKNNQWDRKNMNDYSGLHVFLRYQDSDNLYVASVRYDGLVTIKEKVDGAYATLAMSKLPDAYLDRNGNLDSGDWVNLKASAIGTTITFYLNDIEVLAAYSDSLEWGTTGIRTDKAEVFFNELKMEMD